MGIDLGSTRCVLTVSRKARIEVVNIDNSTSGDKRWIESVASFDEQNPIIGEAAIRRLRTKPECVIMDWKLSCDKFFQQWRSKNANVTWSAEIIMKNVKEPYFEVQTINGMKEFSLAELNKVFLETMKQRATAFQEGYNTNKEVKRAVITVPQYPKRDEKDFWIENVLKAADMAGIEVIDIIEEVHADLLYYLSNEKYAKEVKIGDKIAIFDIGGGTGICRIYDIVKQGRKQAKVCGYMECTSFGRSIDDKLMEGIAQKVKNIIHDINKPRLFEVARKIKHELSFSSEYK